MEDNNINVFEGATFGDKFVTRDGSKLMFVHYLDDIDAYHCVLENWYETLDYAPNGKAFKLDNHPTDIISRYQEPITSKEIDEDELSKYAFEECPYEVTVNPKAETFFEGFYSGYKKAKKE